MYAVAEATSSAPTPTIKEIKHKKIEKQKASEPIVQKNKYKIEDKNDADIVINNDDTSYLIEQLIYNASENLGVNYRGGGMSKAGFDCSGLIYSTFKKYDIELPRSSHEMAEVGSKINPKEAKKGDLIFFINRGQRRINHVGMIVEASNDEIKFIHSSTQSGVTVSSTKEPYYHKTFAQINRVVQ